MIFTKASTYKIETYERTLDVDGDPTDIRLISTEFSNKNFEALKHAIEKRYIVSKQNDRIFLVNNGTLKIIITSLNDIKTQD